MLKFEDSGLNGIFRLAKKKFAKREATQQFLLDLNKGKIHIFHNKSEKKTFPKN